MTIALLLLVAVLVVIVLGSLKQLKEKNQNLLQAGEEIQALRRDLTSAKSKVEVLLANVPNLEREAEAGHKGLSLLASIVWNKPWARTETGPLMCFYCQAEEHPDHSVKHNSDCYFVQAHQLLHDHDVARGALPR
jgi:hypothetical protein